MMMHLEIGVDDLLAALEHAIATGATLAAHQPQDDVRVTLHPAGYPFLPLAPRIVAARSRPPAPPDPPLTIAVDAEPVFCSP